MGEIRTIPPMLTKTEWNALLDHGLEREASFIIRSGSVSGLYEAISGSGIHAGKIAYSGSVYATVKNSSTGSLTGTVYDKTLNTIEGYVGGIQQNVYDYGVNLSLPASYVIWSGSGLYWSKNGSTGKIDFSGSDASTVISGSLNALTSGRTWMETVVLKGNFTIASKITVPSYTKLVLDAKLFFNFNDVLLDIPSLATRVEICGGYIESGGSVGSNSRHIQVGGTANNIHLHHTYHYSRSRCIYADQGNISDLWIDHNYITGPTGFQAICGITLGSGNTDNWVEDNEIIGFDDSPIAVDNAAATTIQRIWIQRNKINRQSAGVAECIELDAISGNITNVWVKDNIFLNSPSNGMRATGDGSFSVQDSEIIGNHEINAVTYGFNAVKIVNSKIMGNTFPHSINFAVGSTGNIVKDNFGYINENSGTTTISAQSGSFAHGLYTGSTSPPKVRITVTGSPGFDPNVVGPVITYPSGSANNWTGFWVRQTGSGTIGFNWEAEV